MVKRFTLLFVCILAVFVSGCASKLMAPVPAEQATLEVPDDKSMVVFLRPSSFGGAIQASLFDTTTEENEFIGIISYKTMIAHVTEPGEHIFMVVGESADFMKAELLPGLTYYALVTPRMGAWKARFSLKPVHKEELNSEKFMEYQNKCRLVTNTPESRAWAQDNQSSIREKREKYWPVWQSKDDNAKPTLYPGDGQQ